MIYVINLAIEDVMTVRLPASRKAPSAGFPNLLFALLATLASFSVAMAGPALSGSLVNGGTALRLDLSGSTGTNYTIESSIDLKSWSPLTNGAAVNGLFTMQVPIDTGALDRFFRARETGSATLSFPTNVVLSANTNLSVTTIVATNGGSAVLYGTDGTQFTFTVPPLTLPESQLITITLVTNIDGLPFAAGMFGAVQIEPDGLNLWGAGTLQITIPTGTDRRKIASFGARVDGTEFHLVPDRVKTNGVVIPVMRLGMYGSGLAERKELPSADLLALTAEKITTAGGVRAEAADPTDCFPDRTAFAHIVELNLNSTFDAASQKMGAEIDVARELEQAGFEADEQGIFAQAEETQCLIVKTQIQIYYTEALSNCALGTVLFEKLNQIERQRQLLGIPQNPDCPSDLSSFPFCGFLQNCLQEVDTCCIGGRKGPGRISMILGLKRQDELLGSACLSSEAYDKAISDCSSNAWFGSFTFNAKGDNTDTENNPGFTRTTEKGFSATYDGQVWESIEQNPGGIPTVNLRIKGQISWDDAETDETQTLGACGGKFGRDHYETVAATSTWFHVQLQLLPGGAYILFAENVDDATGFPGALAKESTSSYTRTGIPIGNDCIYQSTSFSTNNPSAVLLPPIPGYTGTYSGTNVNGSFTFPQFIDDPPADGHYQWQFKRNTVPAAAPARAW